MIIRVKLTGSPDAHNAEVELIEIVVETLPFPFKVTVAKFVLFFEEFCVVAAAKAEVFTVYEPCCPLD